MTFFLAILSWIQVKINLTLIAVDFLLISPRMSIISFLFCTTRHIFANFHLHLRHSGWPRMWLVDGTRLYVKYAATFYVSLPWKINKMSKKKSLVFYWKTFSLSFFSCVCQVEFLFFGEDWMSFCCCWCFKNLLRRKFQKSFIMD